MMFRIGVACGGTGGHVMPGLATAYALRKRGHEVTLWITGKEIEELSVAQWPGEIVRVPAEGFPTRFSIRGLRAAWRIWRSAAACRRLMRGQAPDAVLAMGSYASAGPVLAARRLRVPYVLHEANVLPGRAVRFLSRWAKVVACQFEETRFYLPRCTVECVGMPLRKELIETMEFTHPDGLDRELFTLLIMGGSAGAHVLNETATEAVCEMKRQGGRIQVIHLCGSTDEAWVRKRYEDAGVPCFVKAFVNHMAPLYRAADLAVCRAGASTCAEICLFGVASLMVPYPHAANDHQTANARALEKMGGVDVVPETDCRAPWLVDYIAESMRNPNRLARMSAALKKRSPEDAAERLADLVEARAMDRAGVRSPV